MPYLPSDAAKKSEIYNNILNGSEIEYQKEIDFLKEQQQISGSLDANTPLRDDDGFLVSFESKEAGVALEEEFEEVRLENAQYFFEGELDDGELEIGQISAIINKILPVEIIVNEIIDEYNSVINELKSINKWLIVENKS